MQGQKTDYWQKAKKHLSRKDKILARIIREYKGEELTHSGGGVFYSLARAIVGQQISVKAAESIWGRYFEITKADPQKTLKTSDEMLRSAGLSGQKVKYLKSIAEFVQTHNGQWPDDDEEVIKELCKIKGIGRWTAEMFLIFYLQRPNILPLADIGLLKACERHYGIPRSEVAQLSEIWHPYRSVATWYLWRSLDPVPVEY